MKLCWIAVVSVALAGSALAQRAPHVAYVYPAGGKAGSTFKVVVGGQFLNSISNVYVSGTGVEATVVGYNRPMTQKEFNELRERFRELHEKFRKTRLGGTGTNEWTAEDATEREVIRNKILKNPPNRAANPAMAESVVVNVSIATNAACGQHDLRLMTPLAVSNPLRFWVGGLSEVVKPTAIPANPDLDKFFERLGRPAVSVGTPHYEAHVSLPATVNGQIMPGGVDRYRFSARHGQLLVFQLRARELMPFLADAVPGWFEATLTIFDEHGNELASAERFRSRPDPLVSLEVPYDGEYTVEIHDSVFRGRQDFVYRLAIGELPVVTGIFPLGGRRGEQTRVSLSGWNLPQKMVLHDNVETGVSALAGDYLNAPLFAVDDLPECFESSVNGSVSNDQVLELPVIINGRIEHAGEQKRFKFQGQAGEKLVAEVMARRLGSPLDSLLRLTGPDGKQLAINDDYEDGANGLETHHADSYLLAELPSDGTYSIQLTDTQGHGGPEFVYRLRISEPRPDFILRAFPSAINLRAGLSVPLTVVAVRRDGFDGGIEVGLTNASAGLSLSGARIAPGQSRVQFTLKAAVAAPLGQQALSLEGRAVIAGKLVSHGVSPAEDMMQAFFYHHVVPVDGFRILVSGRARPLLTDALKK